MPSKTFTGNTVAELHEAEALWEAAFRVDLAAEGQILVPDSRLFEGRTKPMYLVIGYDTKTGKSPLRANEQA